MFANFNVQENEIIYPGEVYINREIDTSIRNENLSVFVPEIISDSEIEIPYIVLNNGFERLPGEEKNLTTTAFTIAES